MLRIIIRLFPLVFYTLFIHFAQSQNQYKADSIRKLIETQELDPVAEMEAYYWLSAYSTSPDDELT
ncbi:MAG: hypothetical protein OEY56_15120, partial [Cyclobacteriaceae bacterium]|nr:hypothetical protein [Cyclobacteriaceae bacterium]